MQDVVEQCSTVVKNLRKNQLINKANHSSQIRNWFMKKLDFGGNLSEKLLTKNESEFSQKIKI